MLAIAVSVMVGAWLASCSLKLADPITGAWQAMVLNKAGEEVAFKLEIERESGQITGALVNGDQRVVSTGGSFDGKVLKLRYDFYDGELTATLANGELRGDFKRQLRKEILRRELRAWRETASAKTTAAPGADLSGDWGTMTGEFENGALRLTRFDGINSAFLISMAKWFHPPMSASATKSSSSPSAEAGVRTVTKKPPRCAIFMTAIKGKGWRSSV
jgi:hypothetical protein